MKICSVSDCDSIATRRGWCQKHYKRWKTHGDPEIEFKRAYPRIPAPERFWAKVDKSDGCWIWRGGANGEGYGLFSGGPGPDRKTVIAHRYAWTLLKGEIPDGLHLDHLCRVRRCVRPEHLEPVTPSENLRRAWANPNHGSRRARSHCPNGHPYEAGNVYISRGARICKTCSNARGKAQRAAARAGIPYRDPWRT
jgi:hypothetical protein